MTRTTILLGICWATALVFGLSRPSDAQTTSPTPVVATPVPPLTDEDRRAGFPDLESHEMHGNTVRSYVLVDQLEWQSGLFWNSKAWVGGDSNRVWLRTEGDGEERHQARGDVHALFGRSISPWWEVVAGLRQDVGAGPGRTWAAIGIQGRSPYWFELEATAYLGGGGRARARVEAVYDLRLTQRLLLQPKVELETNGKADPEAGLGTGTSSLAAGLRLRYEIRREIAPYVGLTWSRSFFASAAVDSNGDTEAGARLAAGLRLWF